jgi:hypothetical protein
MLPLWLSRMQRDVKFKETLEKGDLIITNIENHPIYGIVMDVRAHPDKKDHGQWWDIDLIYLFVPPIKGTITVSTDQLAGREKWAEDEFERFIFAINLKSVGNRKKLGLKLVK